MYADLDGNGIINPANEIIEENNYYPFGLKHEGYNEVVNSNRSEEAEAYKLNGKEYEDSFGLNIYEMDLRQLDPAIGRWLVQDPVVHHDYSPYSAFDNNPVYWSDPSGADATGFIKGLWDKSGSGLTSYTLEDGQIVDTYYDKDAAEAVQNMYELSSNPDDTGGGGGYGNGKGEGVTQKTQQKDIDLVKLFDVVLKNNKVGTTLKVDDIIKKYNLSPKLKDAINSITILQGNKIKIDWKNERAINMFSKINVKDGVLGLKRTFIPSSKGSKKGWNGYIVTGDALEFNNSNTLFIMSNSIYNYYPKTNTISNDGAGF